jgi:hypothetical protein
MHRGVPTADSRRVSRHRLGHLDLVLDLPVRLASAVSGFAFLDLAESSFATDGEPAVTVTAVVEVERGDTSGDPEYRIDGRIGDPEWRACAPIWWDAEGQGLERVRARLREDRPQDLPLGLRSFLRLLLAETFLRTGGIALHASAVSRAQGAIVMMAPSGGGKTTTVTRFAPESVLADDFTLVSPCPGGFCVPRSPLPGREGTAVTGSPARLWRLVEIEKAAEAGYLPLRGGSAMAAVVRAALVRSCDLAAREALLDVSHRLAVAAGIGRLKVSLSGDPWGVL